jgi:hypothetical protein
MSDKKLIVEGDTEVWTDCPPPHHGGGTGVLINSLDTLVEIEGKAVIVRGQPYTGPDGCAGSAGATVTTESLIEIDGLSVVLEDDAGTDGCHGLLGAISGQQDFVTSE